MKKFLVGMIMIMSVVASTAYADELVQMSNGMTCWRNDVGFMYGCSGGVQTGDSGFNEVRTGTRYEYINDHQALDTRTGQPTNIPPENRPNNYR